MKICIIEGCEKKYLAKGLCDMHYTRNRTHGDPNITLKTPKGECLEFLYKAIKLETDDCIIWPYSKSDNGYGVIHYKGKKTFVHRLALILTVGEPLEYKPNALHVPEICHNRACSNPRHLYWGSYKDNQADRLIDGTSNQGERSSSAKLTEAQVLDIRADNRVNRLIALDYDITRATVTEIKTRRTWKHI
jgi:hypothetical protein